MELFKTIIDYLLNFGYLGIFVLMFIESSFIPFPSEVVMIPAGYFAYLGKLSIFWSIFYGIAGSIGGALLNYYLSLKLGRALLIKYKIIKQDHLEKSERFFEKYGGVSTFFGRLLPVIRQYISIPAGVSKMNIVKFITYTGLGAGLWVAVLVFMGYFIGDNQELIMKILSNFKLMLVLVSILVLCAILFFKLKKKKRDYDQNK